MIPASRRALGALLAIVFLAVPAVGQPEIPQTPAGKVFAAWLASFNSADAAQIRAFDAAYPRQGPTPPVEDRLEFRQRTGGFTLVRVEKSEALGLTVLLREKDSDTIARYELTVSADDPPKVLKSIINATQPPPDLAVPRMSEADALAALSAYGDELAKNDQFSGTVLVARHGKILFQKAWGRANRETGAPVTLDTRFRIGSMNKMFTSVAILQLVEAGKLSLDDPIGKYLTDYPNKDVASKVTVRHLLTHTGGTGDIFGPEFDKNRLSLRTHGDYLKLYGSRALDGEPGKQFKYSNYGFVLLGAVIEKVTGMSYYDYVDSRIFKPAGMTSTGSLTENEAVPNRSTGYMKSKGAWVPNTDTLPWRGTSAGGGYSTAGDLLRFAEALESGKLISKASLAQATKAQVPEGYGFGFESRDEGPLRGYGHGGGAPGMNGELRIYPQIGTVVVALSNLDPPAATRMVSFYTARMPATP